MKLTGDIQAKVRRFARVFGIATMACIVLVSLWTPFLEQEYFLRWFSFPAALVPAPVPVLVALIGWRLWTTIDEEGRDWVPFVLTCALFGLCFVGLGISMWPHVIPPSVTIYDAASPAKSQLFMFVGAIVLVPVILAYTAYAYWVFRGKLEPGEGYH